MLMRREERRNRSMTKDAAYYTAIDAHQLKVLPDAEFAALLNRVKQDGATDIAVVKGFLAVAKTQILADAKVMADALAEKDKEIALLAEKLENSQAEKDATLERWQDFSAAQVKEIARLRDKCPFQEAQIKDLCGINRELRSLC